MPVSLRPYQQQLLDDIRAAMRQGHRRILAVMPTGAGKGTTIGAMVASAAAKGKRTLVLAHRAELIGQLSKTASQWDVRHGVIQANRSMDLSAPVQIGSVQTVARRLHKLPAPDIIIQDEAHHLVAGNTWGKIIDRWPNAYLIGKTATPTRLSGEGLGAGQGGYFTTMVLGPTAQWLTDNGYLANARVLAPPGFDTTGLRKRMGDFDTREAEHRIGTIMGDCLSHYRKYLDGQTAIAFCCSVAHAEAVASLFQCNGIPAASIDGSMTSEQRRDLLQALGAGRIKVLTSCALIGEGVDVPSVGGCILLRPTASTSLHLQMIGRCLRPSPGKAAAVVLDHVGNTLRLGHHLEPREWTLDGERKRDRDKAPSVKVCPQCFAAMASQARQCGECGHAFAAEARELQQVEGELQEIEVLKATLSIIESDVLSVLCNLQANSCGYGVVQFKTNKDLADLSYAYRSLKRMGLARDVMVDEQLEWSVTERGRRVAKYNQSHAKNMRREQGTAQSLDELRQLAQQRGYKRGWAERVYQARLAKRQGI